MRKARLTDKEPAATLSRLYRLRATDIKLGLETETAILQRLRNPEQAWRSIHVAGTNGKGSVCAMLESVLRAAGFRTGLYTSPHLVCFNERIRVNGRCIPDNDLADLIRRVEDTANRVRNEPGGRQATFFELATAMAFEHFRDKKVDIAVIETGMGGRLDATNVISPLVSVITGISLDHAEWLGRDIESIAREKCGIIKPGIPVVLGNLTGEALNTSRNITRERGARLVQACETLSVQLLKQDLDGVKIRLESGSVSYGTVAIPLPGSKTPENAAIAVTTLETLSQAASLDIQPGTLKKGLERVSWPGRFHVISRRPPIVADGAHNPEAAEALVRSLRAIFRHTPIGLVCGMASDKDAEGFLRPFAGIARRCWAVPIRNDRSLSSADMAEKAKMLSCPVSQAELPPALDRATEWAVANGGAVCIAGSLFLVGEVLELKTGASGNW